MSFLLLKRGDQAGAMRHLESFLGSSPAATGMEQWVSHAQQTLAKLRGEAPQIEIELGKETEKEPGGQA